MQPVATRSQMARARKPQNQAKTVAAGCDRLPRRSHGKEGVSGSSPEEGSAKVPETEVSFSDDLHVGEAGKTGAIAGRTSTAHELGASDSAIYGAPATAPANPPVLPAISRRSSRRLGARVRVRRGDVVVA